jgi:hypothetical protein
MKVATVKSSFSGTEVFQVDGFKNPGILDVAMNPPWGRLMSNERSAAPAKHTPPEQEQSSVETTAVFLKPCFGITVQRSTLCVSVSAKPNSGPACTPGCG